jgi:hypothetical protein
MPVIPLEPEEVPEVSEPVVPQMPETVVSETPMGSVEMPTEQPNTPVKTRLAFDWSNVKEEPHRRPIPNVKSPWDQTGSIDEEELFAEMKPSNDRSRTMNFIDVLKAEREEAEKNRANKPKEHNFDYTQVLHLDLDNPEEPAEEEQHKLHFAPIYEDVDSPVSTPFDESGYKAPAEEPVEESPAAAEAAPEEIPAAEKPAWKWFEMPDFLKPKVDTSMTRSAVKTPEEVVFEEPKYEELNDAAEVVEEADLTVAESVNAQDVPFEEPELDVYEEEPAAAAEMTAEPEAIAEEEQEAVAFEAEPATEIGSAAEAEVVSADADYSDYLDIDTDRPYEDGETQKRTHFRDLDDDIADILASGEQTYDEPARHAEPEEVPEEETVEPESAVYEEEQAAELVITAEPETEPVAEAEPVPENETEAEDTAIDEAELFAEMSEAPAGRTGMTIAAPADKESEIESLKKRLAELMGAPADDTVPAEEAEEPAPEVAVEIIAEETVISMPEEQVEAISVEAIGSEEVSPEPVELTPAEVEPAVVEQPAEEPEKPLLYGLYDEIAEETIEETHVDSVVSSFEDELASFLADAAVVETPAPPVNAETQISQPDEAETVISVTEIHAASKPEVAPAEETTEPAVLSLDDLLVQKFGDTKEASKPVEASPAEFKEIPAVPEPVVVQAESENKPTDAMSLEDLESDLFGDSLSADAEAEVTKKIDKFYTLYRKNEEFQKLLDEEYNKLKMDTEPSAVQKEIAAAMGTPAPVKQAEDKTIYQGLEEIKEIEALKAAQTQPEESKPAEVKAPPVELVDDTTPSDTMSKKERKQAEKERRKKEKELAKQQKKAPVEEDYDSVEQGSTFLTVIAVIIAILLVFLLAVILVLNFAPDSGIALQIDSVIENITSHFGALDAGNGEYLL